MSDKKSSADGARLEEELEETVPFYLTALTVFLNVFFFFYDVVVFIPFKIFADPEKKKARSEAIKAEPVVKGDPASPWRHVDTRESGLWTEFFQGAGCDTLGKIWDEAVRRYADSLCMGSRDVVKVFEEKQKSGRTFQKLILGEYHWQEFSEVDETITNITQGLISLGIQKGQHVVIYAETRAEWMQTAIACFKLGLPVVTVYATLGEEAVEFAMKECDAVAVFTTRGLLSKVAGATRECPSIKNVIYYYELHQEPSEKKEADEKTVNSVTSGGRQLYSFDTLVEMGSNHPDQKTPPVKADDLAMIMYTSGTTGNPKGVMLTHRNIIAAISGQSVPIPVSTGDVYIGYLPLAHILEVCAELVVLGKGCRIGYSSAQTLFDRAPKIQKGSKGDCAALGPTLIACVPAVMDRIFKAVADEVKSKPAIFRELFRICYERKRARYEEGYTSLVMNKLAFNRIRKMLGGKLKFVLSGGAPLNPETQRFMNICFCTPVVQGYGLTETCGGGTLADEHDLSTGSVGPPLRSCEIMLREWAEAGYSPKNDKPQGEILISGNNVANGYYKNEEKTKEDFIEIDGKRWFATGDIGEFREDGSLRIIDRKKDLIKLSHGEYISLGKVETTLLTNPLVDNICVYGSSHQDYLIALVVPNQKNLQALADNNNVSAKSFEDLCNDKKVADLLAKELQSSANGKLQRVETPQKVALCHEPWTPASGLLTEALKLKRKNIEKAFEKEIKQLYGSKK